jgi:prepilin peptidase CpaA
MFFPDVGFGWVFYGALVCLTLVASFADLRWLIVPKWITLTGVALGLLVNGLRGAWIGWEGNSVWAFGDYGTVVGLLDGLLFALAGFATGFALFFGLWIIGACGGGDVKLFAAVGAWVGPYHALWLLAGSTFIMVLFGLLRFAIAAVSSSWKRARREFSEKGAAAVSGKKPTSRLAAYSLPLAITTAIMMLWFYRYELQIAEPTRGSGPQARGVRNHAP